MNYPESVEYLYSLGNEIRTAKLGLERMTILAEALSHPERAYSVVHVAGTNGKGSTSAMIASGLRADGHRVGLYTSPHLVEPTERIAVDGKAISAADFSRAFVHVHETAERMLLAGTLDAHPTYFETVTLMAFWWFAECGVDWAVIEVGLGGRLDATNIVTPQLCVITPVDYDHEAWLGKSLDSIAFEKAGILKTGVPVVMGPQRAVPRDVIERRAETVHAPVLDATAWPVAGLKMDARGSRFSAAGLEIQCPLAGEHQVENARTAAVALHALELTPEQIQAGIGATRWPGRLEMVQVNPEIWLDGAHNPSGARALAAYINRFHKERRILLIYGAMRDKSVEEIAGVLFPLADELILTAPGQTRALRPEAILEMEPHPRARFASGARAALAMKHNCDVVFVTGSLYLVGEARAILVQ
ncbi:MAG: bifunctional folylpolyglutamate synthase/dihydrofolate synthase [Bryobacterales bacterium]|nr:bifunctional folylpolyglutamate synthase/dihydrofolate synthase [Bryobacterales bacterium]